MERRTENLVPATNPEYNIPTALHGKASQAGILKMPRSPSDIPSPPMTDAFSQPN
jgi:hypothetical protein